MNIFDLFKFRDPSWMFMSYDGSGGGDGGNDSYGGGGGGGYGGNYGGSYGGYGGNTYSGYAGNYGGNYGISYGGADGTDPGTDPTDPTGGNQSPSSLADGSVQGQEQAAREAFASAAGGGGVSTDLSDPTGGNQSPTADPNANDPSNEFGGGITDPGAGQQNTTTEGGNFPGADTGGAEQTGDPNANDPSNEFGGGVQAGGQQDARATDGGNFPGADTGGAEQTAPSAQGQSGQGMSFGDYLRAALGGAFSTPAAAGELPTEGMPNPNFMQGYNVTGLPAGMKDQGQFPNAANNYNLTGLQAGMGQGPFVSGPFQDGPPVMPGGQSLTGTSPALTGQAPGLTPQQAADAFGNPPVVNPGDTIIGPQNPVNPQVADNVPLPTADPRQQVADNVPLPIRDPRAGIGDASQDQSQFPYGPIGAPSQGQQGQQRTQVASLNDPFRIGTSQPLGPNDPLPEGGTWSNPITPRGSYSTLSDIATGGYAQNQGSWISSLAQQQAMQQPAMQQPAAPVAAPQPAPAPPPGGYGPVPDTGGYVSSDYGPVIFPNTPPAPASDYSNNLFDLGAAP
jgi:hypothetical protein